MYLEDRQVPCMKSATATSLAADCLPSLCPFEPPVTKPTNWRNKPDSFIPQHRDKSKQKMIFSPLLVLQTKGFVFQTDRQTLEHVSSHCKWRASLSDLGPSLWNFSHCRQEAAVAAGRLSQIIRAECPTSQSHQPQSKQFERESFL